MARPKSTPTKTDAGAPPDGADLNAGTGAAPDGADLNAGTGAAPDGADLNAGTGAAPDGADLNAGTGAAPDGADLNAGTGAAPDGADLNAGAPGAGAGPPPPPPVEAPPEAAAVDLLAIFAAFSPAALQDEKKIEATLPDGDAFELAFEPKGWRRAFGGFDIFGLERSRPVLYGRPQRVTRRELVLAIKSVCKPGDVELEDIRVIRL